MGYNPAASGGNNTPNTTPGSGGYATLDSHLKVTPLVGAGPLEKQATHAMIYFADVKGSNGQVRQQFHSGKFLYDILLDPTNASDGAVRQLQEQLYAGGYYGATSIRNIRFGDRSDEATRQALARAILAISAQQHGAEAAGAPLQSFFDLLGAKAQYQSEKGRGGGGPQRDPFAPVLTDQADIAETVKARAPQIIGRALTDDEIGKLTDLYHSMERTSQLARYNNQAATAPPDLSTFVQQEATQLHPDEADTYKKFTLVGDALRILGVNGAAPAIGT